MPPKPKFSKEEIIEKSIVLIEEKGTDALTARELGKYLGSSSCPIFTVFTDMEELRGAVCARAKQIFDEYMAVAEKYEPTYKMRGLQWVKFSAEHPKLFELLLMRKTGIHSNIMNAVNALPFGAEKDIKLIMRDYNATREQAERLFGQMWIYTFGLCVITSKNVCDFSLREVSDKLGEIFNGMVYVIKNVPQKVYSVFPAEAGTADFGERPDFNNGTSGNNGADDNNK